jgi:hypothetical membrane protein
MTSQLSTPQRSTSPHSTFQRAPRLVQLGAICWLLLVVFFVAQALAQAAFVPAYSLLDDRISDLGNTTCGAWLTHAYACSPLHGLVDVSFVATGLLLVLGAALTWQAWPRRKLSVAGLVCVVLAGGGYVLVGLNPEDVNLRLHILGASNLIFSNLALLCLGLATRQKRSWRSRLALGLACVGFVGLLIGPVLLAAVGHGGGLAERLVLYPLVVYAIAMSAEPSVRPNGT